MLNNPEKKGIRKDDFIMTSLEEAREKISEADKEIARYFEIRMNAVSEVAQYKKEHSLPVLDTGRENALIAKNKEYITNEEIRDLYILFQKNMMDLSKKYQSILISGQKIAFSGIEGAYAHIAAKKIFPEENISPYPSFKKAYTAVVNGKCDSVVLPIENSTAGEVGDNIDMIYSGTLFINGIYELRISHNLLGKKGAKLTDIKEVISHSQAIDQCKTFLEENNIAPKKAINTAIAAKQVSESCGKETGAIASKETAALYGLEIIREKINSGESNATRFAVLSRERHKDSQNKLFMLGFTVKHEAGALAKAMNIIGDFGFNMQMIKSRPLKNLLWQYYFFTEIQGNPDSATGKKMLSGLKAFCPDVKLLGSYSKHNIIES